VLLEDTDMERGILGIREFLDMMRGEVLSMGLNPV
jgi:hypothetical protein